MWIVVVVVVCGSELCLWVDESDTWDQVSSLEGLRMLGVDVP